ncbi:2-succinyl-5-enolpyruvyl-6-hydroxy-3-cyclohexene-1-carboxylate synthase [Lentibacillus halodurans]|uniref:2-succinyl-5-enolpyruvyl-6-hydroxy-3-cyclohexene-1-carboxylate synthase n=1 Tax=Lentibacillus halodurans TaxID=237679 RepID=A0A1I0WSL9_9BACI|nr:2-succinyl-5-enolpyruvyl-6-hydroxy-3-cyclohexene-1-carboxylic-acid synthase [Lentibacillus halodurans]SFA91772.1 2-succinyl-5-enolpyruvyl-6-hydroxy-3-cyclohexene-1-carboxylate synthase [Lentibacillus halodurans]
MEHTEKLTRYTANFVDELARSGLTDVVISPGSRSTPLAMTMTEYPDMNQWIVIDERSAAFFALGMAKKKQRAVALVCTSGTAAANYFPAIVEAFYSRVPLLVLTADRPHELRDVGAPQSIGQIKLYGEYAKWFHEMALPEADDSMLTYARNKASRATHTANEGNPGPVHLNFPFREPLIPDFSLERLWGERNERSFYAAVDGKRRLDREQLDKLSRRLRSLQKGLIVCGPQTDKEFADAVTDFAAKWQLPVLADPLSQVRAGHHNKDVLIESYDAILRSEAIRKQLKPDFIIRFGAMPVSKAYLFYVKEHSDIPQFVVENTAGYREPSGNQTEWIYADATQLCHDLASQFAAGNDESEWLNTWQKMNQTTKNHLLSSDDMDAITEGEAIRSLMEVIPDESSIYVGNSMAVRDLDTFFMSTYKSVDVLANRGANGIDGMLSSGLGASAAGKPVTLVLGDLSFFHDMNGLLAAKHYGLNITILVVNNNGGGIFSFLPQANQTQHFETLFGTPLDIDFHQAVSMYGGSYQQPAVVSELKQALKESYQYDGLSVIEVKTDRTANMEWHRGKWRDIEKALLQGKE